MDRSGDFPPNFIMDYDGKQIVAFSNGQVLPMSLSNVLLKDHTPLPPSPLSEYGPLKTVFQFSVLSHSF